MMNISTRKLYHRSLTCSAILKMKDSTPYLAMVRVFQSASSNSVVSLVLLFQEVYMYILDILAFPHAGITRLSGLLPSKKPPKNNPQEPI